MFAYLCADHNEIREILRNGLLLTDEVYDRLILSLDQAEQRCAQRILVAQKEVIDHARSTGAGKSVRLKSDAFLNIDPYIEPRRVEAAGGILVRAAQPEPEILLIYRRGRWDLPKGKRDPGESIEACAMREVREELGINRVRILARLGKTLHGYPERSRFRIKTTYWYLMRTPETRFVPQTEEDIEKVVWMPYARAVSELGFDTLRDHLLRYKAFIFENVEV